MDQALVTIAVMLTISALGALFRRGAVPVDDVPERTVFVPSRWGYVLACLGMSIGISPLFFMRYAKNHDAMAWVFMAFLSLILLAPTISLFHQLLTASVELNAEYLEYKNAFKTTRIRFDQIRAVFVVGLDLYIDHGAPRRFRVPLIFDGSRILVQQLRQSIGVRP